jgi:hypothetical protein
MLLPAVRVCSVWRSSCGVVLVVSCDLGRFEQVDRLQIASLQRLLPLQRTLEVDLASKSRLFICYVRLSCVSVVSGDGVSCQFFGGTAAIRPFAMDL